MNKTKIEWCDTTLNPVVGCTFGCPYCYARNMNRRFGWVEDFAKPQFFPERLNQLYSKNPKVVFMDSMSDVADWTPEQTSAVFAACEANPQHKYLFLTKRPEHYCFLANSGILPEKDNFWWGSTVTGKSSKRFQGRPRHRTFISIEPLLEPLDAGLGSFGAANWIILLSEIDRLTSLLAEQQADIDATDAADRELHAAWESQNKEIDRLKAEQSNEPLTLEALRQMDGKPAYFQFGTGSCGYAVISWETESSLMLYAPDLPDDMYPDICFINMEYNDPDGHFGLHLLGWRAHRRKPEGGEG